MRGIWCTLIGKAWIWKLKFHHLELGFTFPHKELESACQIHGSTLELRYPGHGIGSEELHQYRKFAKLMHFSGILINTNSQTNLNMIIYLGRRMKIEAQSPVTPPTHKMILNTVLIRWTKHDALHTHTPQWKAPSTYWGKIAQGPIHVLPIWGTT